MSWSIADENLGSNSRVAFWSLLDHSRLKNQEKREHINSFDMYLTDCIMWGTWRWTRVCVEYWHYNSRSMHPLFALYICVHVRLVPKRPLFFIPFYSVGELTLSDTSPLFHPFSCILDTGTASSVSRMCLISPASKIYGNKINKAD